jgi:hypothetical protein
MRSLSFAAAPLLVCIVIALAPPCFGQSGDLPRFGAGVKLSTLGIGIEAATGVTRQSNVRGGANFFDYNRGFTQDGIHYGAQLRLRSVEAHYDWFLGHGFHVSPGLLIHNGNRVEGSATVPGGSSFTLGSRSYTSSPANPVAGTAEIDFSKNKANPMLTAGVGNLLRRSGRRLSIGFEGGVVFESAPNATLNLSGSTCLGLVCQNIASNSQIQSDIQSEQNKINNGTPPFDTVQKVLKYYPVISIGVGYRFK